MRVKVQDEEDDSPDRMWSGITQELGPPIKSKYRGGEHWIKDFCKCWKKWKRCDTLSSNVSSNICQVVMGRRKQTYSGIPKERMEEDLVRQILAQFKNENLDALCTDHTWAFCKLLTCTCYSSHLPEAGIISPHLIHESWCGFLKVTVTTAQIRLQSQDQLIP